MPASIRQAPANSALLDDLRARIARLEGPNAGTDHPAVISFGVKEIDAALPGGGLPRTGLHEICAGDTSTAATGFSAFLLSRFAGKTGTVVWCRRRRGLYGPGLRPFGIDPERLIVVFPRTEADLYWAMEEALKSGAVTAVLGEAMKGEPVGLRRLQLAAESGRSSALLLRPTGAATIAGPAISRWRITARVRPVANPPRKIVAPGLYAAPPAAARARWRVDLLRCKAGAPAAWTVEWYDETSHLRLAAEIPDRPAVEGPESGSAPPPAVPSDGTSCGPSLGDHQQGGGRHAAGGGQ